MAHATRSRRADLALLAPSREPEDPFGKVEKCAGEHKPPAAETYRSLYRRQKGRLVSVVETVVNLTAARNEKKKPNDIWSEWQDLNLRPLRPERSALPG
jgi:hypothetical protein